MGKICREDVSIGEAKGEVIEMINYINMSTGEVTENHNTAMEWYREGDEISIVSWSDVLQDWIERLQWVH